MIALVALALVAPAALAADRAALSETTAAGVPLVRIPAGSFVMGSPEDSPGRGPGEILHRVTISRAFWLGKTEVTQAQWFRVMRAHPSRFRDCGGDCPVESVTALDVERFLRKLNAAAGGGFRLPTEAEWEYACRAGRESLPEVTDREANFDARYPLPGRRRGRFRGRPTPVGSFPPNRWGLHDMLGNVWEWCADAYAPYSGRTPAPPGTGPGKRVIRGGSWYFDAASCRCATRYTHAPGERGFSLGFRVARDD